MNSTICTILKWLSIIWFLITRNIYRLVNHFKDKRCVSAVRDDILLQSAVTIASKIRSQEVTSEEVIRAFINRIQSVNDLLNAVVENRFNDAIAEAKSVDTAISTGTAPSVKDAPFYGVPFTLKDCIFVNGMKCTAGILCRRDKVMTKDAEVVQKMRAAGAVVLAITNVSEVCMWWESSNGIYGRTNNPYDTRRIVGGSSGGEACLIAAGGSVFGLGSDIGGSIRMPAFFNGVFGHKPTKYIVSEEGTWPLSYGYQHDMHTAGPICRYAADIAPMLSVLGGTENAQKLKLHDIPEDISDLKFYYMDHIDSCYVHPMDKELKNALKQVIRYLETTFHTEVIRLDLPIAHRALEIWLNDIEEPGCPTFSEELADCTGYVNPFLETIKVLLGLSSHTLAATGLGMFEELERKFVGHDDEYAAKTVAAREKLERQLGSLLNTNGILLFPAHPTLAPFHCESLVMPCNFTYTALFNSVSLPTTQVPLGLSTPPKCLPLGIQVVSGLGNDRLTIAVALELEKAFGGWKNPGT